jgi:hypothetical protein
MMGMFSAFTAFLSYVVLHSAPYVAVVTLSLTPALEIFMLVALGGLLFQHRWSTMQHVGICVLFVGNVFYGFPWVLKSPKMIEAFQSSTAILLGMNWSILLSFQLAAEFLMRGYLLTTDRMSVVTVMRHQASIAILSLSLMMAILYSDIFEVQSGWFPEFDLKAQWLQITSIPEGCIRVICYALGEGILSYATMSIIQKTDALQYVVLRAVLTGAFAVTSAIMLQAQDGFEENLGKCLNGVLLLVGGAIYLGTTKWE